MDKNDRMKFVTRLRANMAGEVSKENWEKFGNGLISKIPFQEKVSTIFVNFYKFLDNDPNASGSSTRRVIKNLVGDNYQKLEIYKLLSEIVSLADLEKNILPTAYSKSEKLKITESFHIIIQETILYIKNHEKLNKASEHHIQDISDKITKLLHFVLNEAYHSAFKNYVKGLKNVSHDVDSYTIDFISERFDRDVYFIDSDTRMLYNNSSTTENIKCRKSLIVLWIDKNHYETVGRLLPNKKIQRDFEHDDPLIIKPKNFSTFSRKNRFYFSRTIRIYTKRI